MYSRRAKSTVAKALIWMAAAVFALPAFPPPLACGCEMDSCGSSCCNPTADAEPPCCGQTSRGSCCCAHGVDSTQLEGSSRGCICGESCCCSQGESPDSLPEPAVPSRSETPRKIVEFGGFAEALNVAFPSAGQTGISNSTLYGGLDRCSALDRCARLSRFTL